MPSEEKSSSSRINLTNWLKPKKSRQKLRKRGVDGAVTTTTTAERGLLSASSTTLVSVKSSATQYSSYHTVKDGKGSNSNNNKNDEVPPIPPLAPLQAHRAKYRDRNVRLDTQLGENADYTTLLHSMSLQEDFDSDDTPYNHIAAENRPPGEPAVASLSAELWCVVADLLDPKTAVCLALASKTLYARLGPERYLEPLNNHLENRQYKLEFLTLLDRDLPLHLLCIPCAQYHRRIRIGKEKLQPVQAQAANPLFHCPNARNVLNPPSRHRIAHGRSIPFSMVQLTLRAHRFGSLRYGITPESLGRRWRTAEHPSTKFLDIDDDDNASTTAAATAAADDWSISTRFLIHENRLLMRVVSQTFARPGLPPSAKRLLLYNRDDYWPYFSVCPHWRDGELMDVCKCALDHIPTPRNKAGFQGIEHKFKDAMQGRVANFDPAYAVPSQCGKCQPMRRCPRCPSEYLVEVKLTEDTATTTAAAGAADFNFTARRPSSSRQVSSNSRPGTSGKDSSRHKTKFRHAIVVTRWTDLGDGSTPGSSEEWASMCDNPDSIPLKPGMGGNLEYDSFKRLGRRGISGIFESAFTHDTIPGKRIVSMNPENKTGGETRNDWY